MIFKISRFYQNLIKMPEEIVLSCLNIQPKCYQQRKTIMVKWLKLPANSIKLNSDGASKGNPGPAGGGCILRDHTGNMVYVLSACARQSLWSILRL